MLFQHRFHRDKRFNQSFSTTSSRIYEYEYAKQGQLYIFMYIYSNIYIIKIIHTVNNFSFRRFFIVIHFLEKTDIPKAKNPYLLRSFTSLQKSTATREIDSHALQKTFSPRARPRSSNAQRNGVQKSLRFADVVPCRVMCELLRSRFPGCVVFRSDGE